MFSTAGAGGLGFINPVAKSRKSSQNLHHGHSRSQVSNMSNF